jgi:hypothetical protein
MPKGHLQTFPAEPKTQQIQKLAAQQARRPGWNAVNRVKTTMVNEPLKTRCSGSRDVLERAKENI